MSEEMPEDGMDISTLDGFLAAIVLNPQLIAPSQWLPWVWDMADGRDSPAFADSQQASRILGLLMRHYNMVLTSISGGWFDPLWMELAQEDGSEFFDAEGWCAGFMLGVKQFPDAWQAVFLGHMELLAPMVLFGTKEGWKALEERGHNAETRKRLTQGAHEATPPPSPRWMSISNQSANRRCGPSQVRCWSSNRDAATHQRLAAMTHAIAARARNTRSAAGRRSQCNDLTR
jgi:uncharacterized protein